MINQNLLLTGDDGYNLTNSLRFRSSASAYLNRTPASATNRRTWTWSGWVKRGTLSSNDGIFSAGTSFGTNNDNIQTISFTSGDLITLVSEVSGSVQYNLVTTQVFRDPAAWYHIVVAFDTTQATSSNRVKLYVNGSQVAAFSTASYPSQNYDGWINSANQHRIGNRVSPDFDGYMAEVNFIDGQQLTPSSFGQTSSSTGVWQPIKYTGTYGTNGFYLPFTDNSALTTSSNVGLGKDFSGNGNYFATNNISITAGSTYDSMTDVPTLTSITTANYCTWNPINKRSTVHIKNTLDGNLNVSGDSNQTGIIFATIYPTTGKWYYEFSPANTYVNSYAGCGNTSENIDQFPGNSTNSVGLEIGSGKVYSSSLLATYTGISAGEIGMIAWDCATGKVWMGRQGTWFNSGDPAAGTGQVATLTAGEIGPMVTPYFSSGVISTTFGQRPFFYTPPTGFVALNTFNLPTPTIGATASTTANKYMDVTTYTGNNTAGRVITMSNMTNVGFAWVKIRSGADDHRLANTVTGGNKHLKSNATDAESSGTNVIQAFSSNTFTVGSDNSVNVSGSTYVGWVWANDGTSGSTNTAGTITSTVSANTSAGFSVVTYTGNATNNATFGHSLGVAPNMVIIKNRAASTFWYVFHSSLAATYNLYLNDTSAEQADNVIRSTSSTTVTVSSSSSVNASGQSMVAYCFAPVAGYSAFGSYTGNGSSDGTFVYTGFRPRFVMVKCSSSDQGGNAVWGMFDTSRNAYNVANNRLIASSSNSESTSPWLDINSNGFKIRETSTSINGSGATYIYMAFAESPFKYANAR